MRPLFPCLALLALLAAPTSAAATEALAPFLGQWQGEGTVRRGDEPEQRFQCRLRMEDEGPYVRLEGRCASAQGATSFLYELTETGGGQVTGVNRTQGDEALPGTLPEALNGRIEADGGLTLASGSGAIRFRRQSEGMQFSLSGEGAEGQVTLRAR